MKNAWFLDKFSEFAEIITFLPNYLIWKQNLLSPSSPNAFSHSFKSPYVSEYTHTNQVEENVGLYLKEWGQAAVKWWAHWKPFWKLNVLKRKRITRFFCNLKWITSREGQWWCKFIDTAHQAPECQRQPWKDVCCWKMGMKERVGVWAQADRQAGRQAPPPLQSKYTCHSSLWRNECTRVHMCNMGTQRNAIMQLQSRINALTLGLLDKAMVKWHASSYGENRPFFGEGKQHPMKGGGLGGGGEAQSQSLIMWAFRSEEEFSFSKASSWGGGGTGRV